MVRGGKPRWFLFKSVCFRRWISMVIFHNTFPLQLFLSTIYLFIYYLLVVLNRITSQVTTSCTCGSEHFLYERGKETQERAHILGAVLLTLCGDKN